MRHLAVDRWSREAGPLHARDARAKLAVLLVFLVSLSTTPTAGWLMLAANAILVMVAAIVSRLPLRGLLLRSFFVFPFPAAFALMTWWVGDRDRALTLAAKALLSTLAGLLLIATTPVADLTAALEAFRLPRTLVLVIQFLYRYLFVIAQQARNMHLASLSRGRTHAIRFRAAAGAAGVLFVKSWERADGIYAAMLARGFRGRMPQAVPARFAHADFTFLYLSATACAIVRLVL